MSTRTTTRPPRPPLFRTTTHPPPTKPSIDNSRPTSTGRTSTRRLRTRRRTHSTATDQAFAPTRTRSTGHRDDVSTHRRGRAQDDALPATDQTHRPTRTRPTHL